MSRTRIYGAFVYGLWWKSPPHSFKGFPRTNRPREGGQTNCRPECSESVALATMLTVSVQKNLARTLLPVTGRIIYQAQRKREEKWRKDDTEKRNKTKTEIRKREHFCHVKLSECAFSHYLRFLLFRSHFPQLSVSWKCNTHTHTLTPTHTHTSACHTLGRNVIKTCHASLRLSLAISITLKSMLRYV